MLITDVGSGVRKMNHMVFLNEKDVCSLLTPADAIAAAEETFLHIGLGGHHGGRYGAYVCG